MKRFKFIIPLLFSLVFSVMLCNYRGDAWEQTVRNTLYKITNDSIPDFAKEQLDEKGIPFVHYPEQNGITAGNQYNATIVSNYSINYFLQSKEKKDSSARTRFKNCVEWLADSMQRNGSYALYKFNWQQPWYPFVGFPYTSGMTSGRAIEALTYAAQTIDSIKYLNNAKALLRGFYVPIDSGGFTYQSNNGWWYEELAYPNTKTPRILDGHIFAITGVHKYWLATKDDSARYIVQQGVLALKQFLPQYYAGEGWSYYDIYKKRSDKKYHRILTDQMQQMFVITKDPFFLNYYNKWNAYFQTPYLIRSFKENNKTALILFAACFVVAFLLFRLMFYLVKKLKTGN